MKKPVFTGSSVAIVTPFTEDFVDFESLGELIEYQIAAGTSAITVCGTTGEASTQTIPEHLATVEYCVKRVAGRVPVIAGTGSNDTAHAVMMSQNAEKSGADALLLVTPYYNKTSQNGLVKHYLHVADRVNIPIILYNVPTRTGMSISLDAYKALSRHPNINGVKEASSDFPLIAQIRAECGDELNVWSGNDNDFVAMMALGAHGVISVAANVIPKEMAEMCRLFLEGKHHESAAMQFRFLKLINALFMDVNPIPVKMAMRFMGLKVGQLRMPLCDMPEDKAAVLKTVMKEAGLTLTQG